MSIPSSGLRSSGFRWALVLGVLVGILLLSVRALVPPRPLGPDAPPDVFSEGRARAMVRVLTEDIGRRVNGTPEYDRTVAYLTTELGKIPGVEVATQDDQGVYFHPMNPAGAIVYRVSNVLARLPGRSSEAILLDAHFDTLVDSVGAADDGAGVACLMETLRVLAAKAPLDRTVVVLLNGGEERGQLGALSALKHPWVKQARAYIYLEALPGGRAALIGAGPNNPWLAQTFAQTVRLPLGNVLAQELAQSGLLPFAGDFTPFHKAGLPGLDLAMIGDAWALHTELDRVDRLAPGGLQHMGDATLAAALALTSAGTRLQSDTRPTVYYDLLGTVMIAHSVGLGQVMGVCALALLVFLVVRMRARGLVTLKDLLGAFGWSFLTLLAAILAALLPTLILRTFHRSVGWLSQPGLVLACFALPAAAAVLAMHAWWCRRALRRLAGDGERMAVTVWLGALAFWAFWLLLATIKGSAVGYVSLYWVAGGSLGLAIARSFPRARVAALLVALIPGALVTIEMTTLLVANMAPMAGMMPSQAPIDAVLATMVAFGTGLVGLLAVGLPGRTALANRLALGCAVLAILGMGLTAAQSPYTAQRPKRLLVTHAADDQGSALLLAGEGVMGTRPLLPVLAEAKPAPPSWPPVDGFMEPFTLMLPASEPPMPAPRAEVTQSEYDAQTDTRHVKLHLHGTSPELRLHIPSQSLVAWSASEKLPAAPEGGVYGVAFEGVRGEGVDFEMTLRGQHPVAVTLRAIDGKRPSGPEVSSLAQHLPDWVTVRAFSYRITQLKL
jgi:hypothetical protein